MKFIKEDILNEMALTKVQAENRILDKSYTFLEHFLKVCLYPDNINQNKWRNELATKISECGAYKSKSTNKKFKKSTYTLLFTAYSSTKEELESITKAFIRQFKSDGLPNPVKIDIDELFVKINNLQDKAFKLILDNKKDYNRNDYRKIVDEVL